MVLGFLSGVFMCLLLMKSVLDKDNYKVSRI
nr:MAG TPA: hypothetical protein [Caudoviricetes sp.]